MPDFRSRPPASLYVAGPFAMGYTEFYNFLIPLYGRSLGMSAGEVGMLVGARGVSVDSCRRADGPVRHPPCEHVLCLDGNGPGARVPAPALVLAIAAAADRQRRRAAVCLVGFADLDRPIGRRGGGISRPVQLFRAHRDDRGTDDCRCGLGFRRPLALLCTRLC